MKNDKAGKSDEELVLEFKSGDMEAFDTLVKRHKDPLVEFTARFIGNYHYAEDIVQESFLRVYKSIGNYKPLAKFSTWLYKIAINLAHTYLKRNPVRRFSSLDAPFVSSKISSSAESPLAYSEKKELSKIISSAIGRLSKKHKAVFIMRDIQGMKYEDISSTLGCSLGTVKSRLNRARLMLKDLIRPYLKR